MLKCHLISVLYNRLTFWFQTRLWLVSINYQENIFYLGWLNKYKLQFLYLFSFSSQKELSSALKKSVKLSDYYDIYTNTQECINIVMMKLYFLNIWSDRLFPPCSFFWLFCFSYLLPDWKTDISFWFSHSKLFRTDLLQCRCVLNPRWNSAFSKVV